MIIENTISQRIIFCNYQSEFRPNHSSNLCLSYLTEKILKEFDQSLLTEITLVDLEKEFDTIKFFVTKAGSTQFIEINFSVI